MDKFDYIEGFCPKLKYKGQWPCLFSEKNGRFEKQKMICTASDNTCLDSCPVFSGIPQVFPPDREWILKDVEKGAR